MCIRGLFIRTRGCLFRVSSRLKDCCSTEALFGLLSGQTFSHKWKGKQRRGRIQSSPRCVCLYVLPCSQLPKHWFIVISDILLLDKHQMSMDSVYRLVDGFLKSTCCLLSPSVSKSFSWPVYSQGKNLNDSTFKCPLLITHLYRDLPPFKVISIRSPADEVICQSEVKQSQRVAMETGLVIKLLPLRRQNTELHMAGKQDVLSPQPQ